MTPEERKLLEDLAGKIAQTPSPAHDAEAEDFIRTNIGKRPDALYLMTQTVLIQNMAIEHAQQEIEQWKQRAAQAAPAQPPASQGSFLGRGTGWPNQPPPPQQTYAPPAQAPGGMFGGGAGMGSFLKSAGTTAAGVAAGALAFEGIRSMFGGVEHLFGLGNQPRMGGSGFFGGGGGAPTEEIVNNYYGRPGDDRGDSDASGLGPDDSVQYDDTDVPVDDSSSFDDSSSDDSSSDDLA